MTDNANGSGEAANDTNAGRDSGGGRVSTRDRVIGTPREHDETFVAAEASDDDVRHEGPYLPEETHIHSEEAQRTGERLAALWFGVAALAGVGFLVSYFLWTPADIADPQTAQYSNMALGGTIALALFGIGAGMTMWVRRVMPHYEVASPYDDLSSPEDDKRSFGEYFMRGAHESGFTKRPLMRRTLLLAMLPLGIAPIVLLRDLGPAPSQFLREPVWHDGQYMVVEGTGRRIHADDLERVGSMITVLPENEEDPEHPVDLDTQAKAVTLLIRIPDEDYSPDMTDQQMSWTHNGIIAYSKVCTHVGCPAALYERTTHRILCPCHQSTFDAADGARVVFGPAARPLPQLPIRVDEEGYLVAAGDYSSPPGPTFWDAEREAYLRDQEEN